MKFLVTGGCGFIGSHLCETLLNGGHEVRIFDNMSTGLISHKPEKAELRTGDMRDRSALTDALEDVDACFHLAAIASVEQSNRDWFETHRVNQSGTITLFELASARANGKSPKPIVYASSAAVYGDLGAEPIHEHSPASPLSAYGADKLGCDQHAKVAGHVHGLPVIGLRFFNVYGPRQRPDSPYSGVISIFCDRIAHRKPVTIFGDGHQTRDFVYVSDVVEALVRAMAKVTTDAHVLNICTGRRTSVLSLVSIISAIVGERPRLIYQPSRAGEIRTSVGDPGRAHEILDFCAGVSLETGLASTLSSVASRQLVPA